MAIEFLALITLQVLAVVVMRRRIALHRRRGHLFAAAGLGQRNYGHWRKPFLMHGLASPVDVVLREAQHQRRDDGCQVRNGPHETLDAISHVAVINRADPTGTQTPPWPQLSPPRPLRTDPTRRCRRSRASPPRSIASPGEDAPHPADHGADEDPCAQRNDRGDAR